MMSIDFSVRRDFKVREQYFTRAREAYLEGNLGVAEMWLSRVGPGRHYLALYYAYSAAGIDRLDLLAHAGRKGAKVLLSMGRTEMAVRALSEVGAFGALLRLADLLVDAERYRDALLAFQALAQAKHSFPRRLLRLVGNRLLAAQQYEDAYTAYAILNDGPGSIAFAEAIRETCPELSFHVFASKDLWDEAGSLIPALLLEGRSDLIRIAVRHRPELTPRREELVEAGRRLAARRRTFDAWACFELGGDASALIGLAESLASEGLLHVARALAYAMASDARNSAIRSLVCVRVGELLCDGGRDYLAAELFVRVGESTRVRAMVQRHLVSGNDAAARELRTLIPDDAPAPNRGSGTTPPPASRRNPFGG